MKTAIMQPYFFPYIGYFQLMCAVDNFIYYDTANYIKGGWINRNRILGRDGAQYWGLPVHAGSFMQIHDVKFIDNRHKLLKTLGQQYSKAPYFKEVMKYVVYAGLFMVNENLWMVDVYSIDRVFAYLNLKTPQTSLSPYLPDMGRNEKIIEMCKMFDTDTYINAIGGKELYKQEDFPFKIKFLRTGDIVYDQGREFVPNLSIIDVLMWNSPEKVKEFLFNDFKLEDA